MLLLDIQYYGSPDGAYKVGEIFGDHLTLMSKIKLQMPRSTYKGNYIMGSAEFINRLEKINEQIK